MKRLTLTFTLICLFGSFTFNAFGQSKVKRHILITSSMDTLRNLEILPLNKQTNRERVSYLDEGNRRHVLEAKKVHSFYNGTLHQTEKIGKTNELIIVAYEVKGPLSFGYARDVRGDYSFYLKQGEQIVAIPKEEAKTSRSISKFIINYREFRKLYKKTIYPEYKSLAEMTSAYNAFVNPIRYKAKRYTYLENPKMSAYASLNYDNIKATGYKMDYSFNVGVAIENAYSRSLKVLFIPSISMSKFSKAKTNQTIDLKSLGIEGSLGYSFKGIGDFELNVGPTLGAKYFFDSSFTTQYPEVAKIQAIETLKVTWGGAAWAKLSDRWRVSARYINYGLQISATGFDNLLGKDNSLNISSFQVGAYYRIN